MKAVLLIAGKKGCSKCGEAKEAKEFHKSPKKPSGLSSRNNYLKHKDERAPAARARVKEWRGANRERALSNSKAWAEANPEAVRESQKRCNRKYRSTPKGKLTSGISRSINSSLRSGAKAGRHWETLVDFTIDQLKDHLEKQFTPDMTWGNHGAYWHIDHKIPIAVFNYEKPEHLDFRLCWSLKNLQPLAARKNMSKGAKLDKPFQPSFAFGIR